MGREITAEGMVSAQVQQTCVVTGDALPTTLEFSLLRRYSEDADALAGLDVDEDEVVESPTPRSTRSSAAHPAPSMNRKTRSQSSKN